MRNGNNFFRVRGGFTTFCGLLLIPAALAVLLAACSSQRVVPGSAEVILDGKYDIAFPYGGDRKALQSLLESIRLLNSSVYYETFTIPVEDQIKKKDIRPELFKGNRYPKSIYNDFAVGTATIIYYKENRIAVLTCAHVVDFADTLFTYYEIGRTVDENVVATVAIKKRQSNYVTDFPQGDQFEILALDRSLDIVVLGKKIFGEMDKTVRVFRYPLGRARELDWGALVYVVGFPSGKKMITSGIVSSPNRNQNHDFLLDALFNRGFSGGIVLAIRDGLPNFELVGMVNAVAADSEIFLVPRDASDFSELNFNIPYTGDIYARPRKKINYGISYGISIESIEKFLKDNRDKFESAGYQIEGFFRTATF